MENNYKIAITIGDVGGIGPEIIVKALNSPEISSEASDIIVIGNKNLLHKTAEELGYVVPDGIEILDIPFDASNLIVGKPTSAAGTHSFKALKKACEMAKHGKVRAIVTAPLSKKAINSAGYYYSGQTEILEEFLRTSISTNSTFESLINKKTSKFINSKIKKIIPNIIKRRNNNMQPEMLFVAANLRVMLLTRHMKLENVSSSLTIDSIIKSVLALNNSLIRNFKLIKPRIAICGLNPHAGESGLFGHEEDYLIKPALKKLEKKYNIQVEGPFPADTLWAKAANFYFKGEELPYDAYIACYHDQGLIPVKMLAMNKAVNTTINLPVIRTSPSHGTAYDIAGQNKADFSSMIEAINLANRLSIELKNNILSHKIGV